LAGRLARRTGTIVFTKANPRLFTGRIVAFTVMYSHDAALTGNPLASICVVRL
jgi:hypothetical protein